MTTLIVFSRDECHLCETFIAELTAWAAPRAVALVIRDVDADAATRRRYGHRIPVLELDGVPVCAGRLDTAELERLLKPRAGER